MNFPENTLSNEVPFLLIFYNVNTLIPAWLAIPVVVVIIGLREIFASTVLENILEILID